MTTLGTGINKLEINRFKMLPGGMVHQTLPKDQCPLLDPHRGTLEHNPIFIDFPVSHESPHGCNSLFCEIGSGHAGGSALLLLANAVDLLVHFTAVEVSILPRTRYSGGNPCRMPRSNTSDFAQTAVRLARKTTDSPTRDDPLESLPLGNPDDVDVFVLAEHRVNGHFLFKERLCEIKLGLGVSAVDLNFHDVCLFETQVELLDLRVCNDPNNGAELDNAIEFGLNVGAVVVGVLLGVFGERLPLGLVPVLVQTSLEFVAQVLGKHGGEGAETARSFDVPDDAHNDHGRRFEDGHGVHHFALVHQRSGTVHVANHVRHAGLVAAERGQVRTLGGIVAGEGADAAEVPLGALLREKTQVAVTRSFELAVRPGMGWDGMGRCWLATHGVILLFYYSQTVHSTHSLSKAKVVTHIVADFVER